MGRLIARIIAAQDGWATPLGDFNHRWLSALFRPIRPLKDFLNGVWLGHPLHAAATDIPIGTLLLVVVLDLIGQPAAADIALVATILFMLAAAVTGAADYTDTDGTARVRATTHSTLMVVALLVLLVSLVLRAGNPTDRTIPIALAIIGFLIVTAGAYIGGDVVYLFGNMVNRHAWRGAGSKWVRLDTGDVTDLSALPEATPAKAKAGINDIVLVRIADTVYALHAVCAHAGGPLAQGTRGRRLHRMPVARARASGWRTGASGADRRCTTSPPTRSAPPRAVATRSGAPHPDRTGSAGVVHHRSVPEIVLPDPSLVVLIGAAGAGKSTFAARHFAPDEVLSSDRFREDRLGRRGEPGARRRPRSPCSTRP